MHKLNGNPTKMLSGQLNSISIARSWLDLGILPVPLKPKSKRPKGGEGWNKLRVTKKNLPRFFHNGDNVGGLWGEPSNWIVDVDLDWDEASEAACRLLPETFVYGRRKRPGSHYLYKARDASGSKRFNCGTEDEDKTVIAEIRSTGSQSVLPPSRHPDGDRYEINRDAEIKAITPGRLQQLVDRVCAAAILARSYPRTGARHDYMHSIAGALLHLGWEDDDVRNFCLAILDAVTSKENDRFQRERTIENTITHYREGHKVYGWNTLTGFVNTGDLALVKGWINAKGYSVAPRIVQITIDEQKDQEEVSQLCMVPGMVGEIAKWAGKRAYLKQPLLDLAVGLMCTALATSNRYVVSNWDTPLQPYLMLLAPTSGGKESALRSVSDFAHEIGVFDQVFQGFQSYHSMLDKLAAPPNAALWLWDEAARKIRTANKSQAGPDYQVITWLIQMYGRATTYSPGLPARKNAIPYIEHPFLLSMAASQPAQLLEAITNNDLAEGLANRFILMDSGTKLPESNLERSDIFPSKILSFCRTLKEIGPPSGKFPFRSIPFESGKVSSIFTDFDYECREICRKEESLGVAGRGNQNALIMSGIVAVGIDPRKPIITHDLADWAIRLSRWSMSQWKKRIDQTSSRTYIEERSKKIEQYIVSARLYSHRALNSKYRDLMQKGFMPRGMLTLLSRHIRGKDLTELLNDLIMAELIERSEKENCEVYYPSLRKGS